MPPSLEKFAGDDCALLIASCDAYEDLWQPFFTLLRRHWPDCPFPVFLGSGERECSEPGVKTLFSEGGRDWSRCMQDYLQQIPQSHVLVMLDDFFLRQRVPTEKILYCLDFSRRHTATQVRLIPRPPPTQAVAHEELVGVSEPASPYRLSTQAAIWDRKKLSALLQPGESIWEFERHGNVRLAIQREGFYSVWHSVLPYQGRWAHHVIEKGRWLPLEKWRFSQSNIGCDFSKRGTLPLGQTLFYHAAQTIESLLTPLGWRGKMQAKKGLRYLFRPLLQRRLDQLGRPQ